MDLQVCAVEACSAVAEWLMLSLDRNAVLTAVLHRSGMTQGPYRVRAQMATQECVGMATPSCFGMETPSCGGVRRAACVHGRMRAHARDEQCQGRMRAANKSITCAQFTSDLVTRSDCSGNERCKHAGDRITRFNKHIRSGKSVHNTPGLGSQIHTGGRGQKNKRRFTRAEIRPRKPGSHPTI